MDPYDFTQGTSIPEEPVDDDAQLRELEKELAPRSVDYYMLLNVSKEATEEEIKESYKRLCRIFHPDKQTDAEKKRAAETKFHTIQKAYEVLTNPQSRVIYDTLGEQGLSEKWQVGPRLKTPEEMRKEYEAQARAKREAQVENLVRSKGEFQLSVDATQVFNPYEMPAFGGIIPPKKRQGNVLDAFSRVELSQLTMRHSFETQFGPATGATFAGTMLARNGMGGGNVVGTVRHTFSPLMWGEFGMALMNPRVMHAKLFRNLDSDTFVTVDARTPTLYRPPNLTFTIGRRLWHNITGYMNYKTGDYVLGPWGQGYPIAHNRSAVAIGFGGANKKTQYSCELQTGIMQSYISIDYTYKFLDNTRIRAAVLLSTGGVTASLGSDHKLTEHSRFGVAMESGYPTGVTVKVRVTRLGQKIVIPIVLSTEFNAGLVFWGTVVPATIVVALDQLVLKPRRKRKIAEKIQELREQHAEFIENRRKEAQEAQLLLSDSSRRKMTAEASKDGLVIVEALYGNLSKLSERANGHLGDTNKEDEPIIDVTIAIQALVNDSKLTIPGGTSKSNIMGFCDPCLGEKKKLLIRYKFQHRQHEVIVDDTSAVACPLRAHVLE
ncbi:hypothetical protein BZG36_00249 [Bifiguratus adelaidae]|uniref:J domain-containing protein n=1 Tax=Bifiguratus adelaidae TaxID=1938954 RepID=A0A261Y8M2_9FUNG|nr:hypothetical protein BZG36_00249 [Bifiguratus adelaidae]